MWGRIISQVEYFGLLYGDGFAQNAGTILEWLAVDRDGEICLVKVVKGGDDICKRCPQFTECNGSFLREWVDRECIEAFGLEVDKVYTLKALLEKIVNFINASQKEFSWRRTFGQDIILRRLIEVRDSLE